MNFNPRKKKTWKKDLNRVKTNQHYDIIDDMTNKIDENENDYQPNEIREFKREVPKAELEQKKENDLKKIFTGKFILSFLFVAHN